MFDKYYNLNPISIRTTKTLLLQIKMHRQKLKHRYMQTMSTKTCGCLLKIASKQRWQKDDFRTVTELPLRLVRCYLNKTS